MSYAHYARNHFVQAEVFASEKDDQATERLAAGLKDLAEALINIELRLEKMDNELASLNQQASNK